MSASNVLVIGGNGFLSGAIVRTALALGHCVWTLTRGQRSVPAGAISLLADRADQAAFAQVVSNAADSLEDGLRAHVVSLLDGA